MEQLKKLLIDNEQWLMERILFYAKKQDYARYTSTLVEAWRLSISGITAALVNAIDLFGEETPEFFPDEVGPNHPVAKFGVAEARLHRRRGISLNMFLGLLKYYRQAYLDLIRETVRDAAQNAHYGLFILRCLDLIELALCMEWKSTPRDQVVRDLQLANRRLTNEKNRYVTLCERLRNPTSSRERSS